jgi:hypothetical protein
MGFPFLFAMCAAAIIVIWFVDMEKGRENCRKYVDERKLLRVAKEAGLTADEVLEGVARGGLGGAESSSATGSAEDIGVDPSKKGHLD